MIRMQGHARVQVIGSSYISVSRKPTRNGSSEAIHLFKGAGVVRIGAGNGSNKSSRDSADFHLGSLHIRRAGVQNDTSCGPLIGCVCPRLSVFLARANALLSY